MAIVAQTFSTSIMDGSESTGTPFDAGSRSRAPQTSRSVLRKTSGMISLLGPANIPSGALFRWASAKDGLLVHAVKSSPAFTATRRHLLEGHCSADSFAGDLLSLCLDQSNCVF